MPSSPKSADEEQFLAAEQAVEQQSLGLKKELRLLDLVGIQILNIVGVSWVGTAGKLGSSHIMFWLPAVLLFYIPSGIVVAHLVSEMPLEGGIYQWARLRFGPLVGFLVALNLWVFNLATISKLALGVTANIGYGLGASGAWISSSRPAILTLSLCLFAGLIYLTLRGLSIGKWINNFGGFAILALFAAMIAVALPRWFRGAVVIAPVALTFPPISLLSLNILGKISFGALSGFDGGAVFAGECRARDPATPIRRSVWLAAPLISTMYILGTACVLVFNPPESIDLVAPMTQVLSLGAPSLVGASALLMAASLIAGSALAFSMTVRFPMVAGWDHLLPAWFGRLHPRYRTPIGSILFAGGVGLTLAILANLGTGSQEAFQLMDNSGGILMASAYLVMFAIPLVARGEKPSLGVRIAATSGFAMTLLYVVLAIFPIIDVESPWLFTAKVAGFVVALECAGAALYWTATRRRTSVT